MQLFSPKDQVNQPNLAIIAWYLTGNVSDGVTFTSETGNQDFIVLLNVVKATIVGDERRDLLAVLDQLHSDALTDGRVRLLRLHTTGT